MQIVCLDFEGVIIPEIWVGLAEKLGIEKLKLTTREIKDYDELMKIRLGVMDEHKLTIKDIQAVVDKLEPLEGAKDFLAKVREKYQTVILSDTFYEFIMPLMPKLNFPTVFCHRLDIESNGRIADYCLRMADHKRHAVKAFHNLNFTVFASGDSYNDTGMLGEADRGFFFCAPENVVKDFPQFPLVTDYDTLLDKFAAAGTDVAGK
ncbi:MAG: bifunctional phosphoserine phosphatase/homoserine phosphotransferase ThrH [Rhodospirillales bacterium]